MKVTRKELMNILGVKTDALKKIISRDQLELRLNDKGYRLISSEKVGKSFIYEIEQENENKETLSNICQYVFNTKKTENFSDYYCSRMMNLDKPITKEFMSEKIKISRKTITKWDEKMLENNILAKDGYFYMAVRYETNSNGEQITTYQLTCKEEYDYFCKISRRANRIKEITRKYKLGEIDLEEYGFLRDACMKNQKEKEDLFIYRIKKYNLIKNNELYKDIFKLIKETYPNKNIASYMEAWLPSQGKI